MFQAVLRIVQPHVMLRRNADGESNAKDLGKREPEEPDGEPSKMKLELVLVAGTIEALDGAKAENALRDIQLTAGLEPDGATGACNSQAR